MNTSILVSGASGIVGYGILKSLQNRKSDYRLIGTSIHDHSVAPLFCDIFEKAVPSNNNKYFDWLTKIICMYKVDFIIPGIEIDMFLWNKERNIIKKTGAFALLNNYRLIDLCRDKYLFYKKLIKNNEKYSIPTVPELEYGIFTPPFILKPRTGYGSKGVGIINSIEEFNFHINKFGRNLIMQPMVGKAEEEFTVSAFFDNASNLIDYISFLRKLSPYGFTSEIQVSDYDFSNILNDLAQDFKPIGPTNFQFRNDKGNVKLLEINPRISSATSIRALLGFNESIMSINYFLHNIIPSKLDKTGIVNKRAIRYSEDYLIQ